MFLFSVRLVDSLLLVSLLPRGLLVETTCVLSGRVVWGLVRWLFCWLLRFLSRASRALLR